MVKRLLKPSMELNSRVEESRSIFLRAVVKSVREAVAIRVESPPENFKQSQKKKGVQRSVVLDVETDKCWNIPRLGHKAMRHKS
jgi:hypothetical protein